MKRRSLTSVLYLSRTLTHSRCFIKECRAKTSKCKFQRGKKFSLFQNPSKTDTEFNFFLQTRAARSKYAIIINQISQREFGHSATFDVCK